jgi:phosphatidylglycerol:prolipoprotein diacylglycerol transferase
MVYVFARRRGIRFLVLADILSAGVALGIGLTRLGCFMAGCCFGRPTSLGCGVVFPADAPASLQFGHLAVHPSQLYGSGAGFLVFALLLILERVWNYRGATFGRFLFLYGLSRFVVDYSRYYEPEQLMALGWSNNQWISLGLMCGGLGVMVWCARDSRTRKDRRV